MLENLSLEEFLKTAYAEVENFDLRLRAAVPAFRSFDISRDVDLIEEILRIHGYTEVEPLRPTLPMNDEVKKPFEEKIRNLLTARGFNEVVTFPWIEESLRELFNLRSYWEIVNPLAAEQRHLRTSLVPSLVKVQKFNQNNFNPDVAIFELGRVYLESEEVPTLGLLAAGKISEHFRGRREWDILTFKGVLEVLLKRFGVEDFSVKPMAKNYMHPYLCGEIVAGGKLLGYFGKLHPAVAEKLELKVTPFVAEINLNTLREVKKQPSYRVISKFPPAKRDLAFVLEDNRHSAQILRDAAEEVFGNLLESFFVFDVYKGERLGEGKTSVAVRVVLRHPERSLSDEEVNALVEKFVQKLDQRGVKLR
jgi:phenylalanyl-tRNA synthetase beta chain